MNAGFSKEAVVDEHLKELNALVDFLQEECGMWTALEGLGRKETHKIDQHDVKLLQEFLLKYANMAKQLSELRMNLSLALPHELRTPLNAILGFSQYLMSLDSANFMEAESVNHIHSSIYESALRLQHLVENYLLYARLQIMTHTSEKEEQEEWYETEELASAPFITCVSNTFTEKVQRKCDLRFELVAADIHFVRKGLQKIFEELLDNACKFSDSGTTLTVRTRLEDEQWILSISDQGRGMTPEQIAKVGAYMQFDRGQYAQQGSGLGLEIVRLLTKLHQGTLHIESRPQQGTTVTLAFPAS